MKDIAIYGAGGFGREVACLINIENKKKPEWNFIGFFDDDVELKGKSNEYGNILGNIDAVCNWDKPLCLLIAIGNGNTIRQVVNQITNPNISFPNFIHHATYSDEENMSIGKGNIVTGAHFSCAVHIGDFNIINGGVVFGHDVKVGNFNSFMPDVRVSGNVIIGDCNFFGINSIILQGIDIKNDVRLGAGSVLMHKPKPGNLYIGNPAKVFKY